MLDAARVGSARTSGCSAEKTIKVLGHPSGMVATMPLEGIPEFHRLKWGKLPSEELCSRRKKSLIWIFH